MAKTTKNASIFRRLLGNARITVDGNKVVPAKVNKSNEVYDLDAGVVEFPNRTGTLYSYLVDNYNTTLYNTNKYRFERYKDLKVMEEISPIVSLAKQIYVSEIFDPGEGEENIRIIAKDKGLEDYFYEWCDDVGVTEQFCRSSIEDIVGYGDAFWKNKWSKDASKGIVRLIRMNPFSLKSRIEFSPTFCEFEKSWSRYLVNFSNNFKSIKDIADVINGKTVTVDALFDQYTLGWEIIVGTDPQGESVGLPPWEVSHARIYTTDEAFFPYGRSPLFGCLAPWKSLMTTIQLQDMLRSAAFPRVKYIIKGGDTMDPIARQKRVADAAKFIKSMTPKSQGEGNIVGVGETMYAIDEFFDTELVDVTIDLDQLGDWEKKEKNLVLATGIPDSYIIPSEGAGELGGDHAESLKYLSKTFFKRANQVKEAFLEAMSETFRMHLIATGQFGGKNAEFELILPVNSEDETADHLDKIQSMFDFAKDMFENLNDIAENASGAELPSSMIADLLKQYLPELPNVNKWVDALVKAKAEEERKQSEEERMKAEMARMQKELEMQRQQALTDVAVAQAQEAEKDQKKAEDDAAAAERDTKAAERDAKRKEQQADVEAKKAKHESIVRTFHEAMKKNPNLVNEMFIKTLKKHRKENGEFCGMFLYKEKNIETKSVYNFIEKEVMNSQYKVIQEKMGKETIDYTKVNTHDDE